MATSSVVKSTMTTESRSAVMLRTFDAEQRTFRQWTFHPGSCGIESRGQWDEATNTLTLTDEKQRITSTATIRFSDKDTMVVLQKSTKPFTALDVTVSMPDFLRQVR